MCAAACVQDPWGQTQPLSWAPGGRPTASVLGHWYFSGKLVTRALVSKPTVRGVECYFKCPLCERRVHLKCQSTDLLPRVGNSAFCSTNITTRAQKLPTQTPRPITSPRGDTPDTFDHRFILPVFELWNQTVCAFSHPTAFAQCYVCQSEDVTFSRRKAS